MMLLDRLYGSAIGARNFLYERRIFKARKLGWPVISVGNLSVGGSGKTPFVIMLGELLTTRDMWVDVLTRGYRRSTRGVMPVDEHGSAEEFGDEPLLIARKLHCPVIVGKSRYAAGAKSEREYAGAAANPVHLLDDGFQHRQLHRDFDIVLLNREDLGDKLLPAGRLREPLSSLERADAVVVSADFPLELIPQGNFAVWRVERELEITRISAPVIAFCGIARPLRFFNDLRKRGLDVREEITFRDHRRYTPPDLRRLAAAQSRVPGSRLVTTEKDAINLGAHAERLKPIVACLKMRLVDPEGALKYMLGTVAERRGCLPGT
jgi:tetraacyldisaccharide 4'-kinase